jgi:hypothetical protein
MYCEGSESGVKGWVGTVQRLRYKDFQLVKKAAEKHVDNESEKETSDSDLDYGKLEEVESVKDFGARMAKLHVLSWWRNGMGYAHDD